MKITRIDLYHVSAPLPAPFHPAWIPGMRQVENHFDLVRMETASGLVGWSAAPSMGDEREGLGALLGPYLLGERADDIPSVRQRIREMSYLGWRVGWLEPACWDILGKALGRPVYELLGGKGGTISLYASTGELRTGKERITEVEALLARGFKAVKLRVHADTLLEDVAQVRDVRKAIGDGPRLLVDANQGWRVAVVADAPRWDPARAHGFCASMGELGVDWVEEPLPMDHYDDLARLSAASPVPIAGGELCSGGVPEFRVMLEKRSLGIYQPDVVFTGGLASTVRIVRMVEEAGARYSPHTWSNGIGMAINLQVFAAYRGRDEVSFEFPLSPPGWIPVSRDALLVEPWLDRAGTLELPRRPGLGFDIDERALRRHGTRYFTATKVRVSLSAIRKRGIGLARHLGAIRDQRLAERETTWKARIAQGMDPVKEALETVEG